MTTETRITQPDHILRFTVRMQTGGVQVNVWMGTDGDLTPRGEMDMTLSQFVFFRMQVLISSKVSIFYEPGVEARVDAVEKSEYRQAERAAALQARP